jgi:hypothetical protein
MRQGRPSTHPPSSLNKVEAARGVQLVMQADSFVGKVLAAPATNDLRARDTHIPEVGATMADAAVPPVFAGVLAVGVPGPTLPVAPGPVPPPLPFPGDPGTVTVWLLERLASILSNALAKVIEAGFTRLMANIPANPTDDVVPLYIRQIISFFWPSIIVLNKQDSIFVQKANQNIFF